MRVDYFVRTSYLLKWIKSQVFNDIKSQGVKSKTTVLDIFALNKIATLDLFHLQAFFPPEEIYLGRVDAGIYKKNIRNLSNGVKKINYEYRH